MSDIKDKEALQQLYNKILPKLAEHLYGNLTDITPLFDDFLLEKILDTWTRDRSRDSSEEISIENGNVQQMGLRLRLNGFQSPGADAFDLTKEIIFKLEHTWYEVGPDKNTTWVQKNYFQPWSEQEYRELADKWTEELIEEITQRVQSL